MTYTPSAEEVAAVVQALDFTHIEDTQSDFRETYCLCGEEFPDEDGHDLHRYAQALIAAHTARAAVVGDVAHKVAKTLWDRYEADYWTSEGDRRVFDPSITERDSDDADRGRDLLEEVTETLALAHTFTTEETP